MNYVYLNEKIYFLFYFVFFIFKSLATCKNQVVTIDDDKDK